MSAIFVSRLPKYDFDVRDLEHLFNKFGKITDCNMKKGGRYGFGFVYFGHPDDAYYAIRETDGIDIDGVRIIVEKARERRRLPTCFDCGKYGHKSAECRSYRHSSRSYRRYSRSPSYDRNQRRRSRSASRSPKRRYYSPSPSYSGRDSSYDSRGRSSHRQEEHDW